MTQIAAVSLGGRFLAGLASEDTCGDGSRRWRLAGRRRPIGGVPEGAGEVAPEDQADGRPRGRADASHPMPVAAAKLEKPSERGDWQQRHHVIT
jgi:hypothetical protein